MKASAPPARLRRRLVALRAGLVLAACLGALALQPNALGFLDALQPSLLLGAAALLPFLVLTHALNAARYGLLAGPPTPPFLVSLGAMIVGAAGNHLLPGRVGEALRATFLREHGRVPLAHALTAVVVGRTCDLGLVAALAVWLVATSTLTVDPLPAALAALAAFAAIGAAAVIGARLAGHAPPGRLWLRGISAALRHTAATLTTGRFALALPLGLAAWAASFLGILGFMAVQPNLALGPREVAVMFVATAVATAIPALPGGLGLYQAAAVLVLTRHGVDFDRALALSIAVHLAMMAPTVLAAAMIAAVTRTGLRGALASAARALTGAPRASS